MRTSWRAEGQRRQHQAEKGRRYFRRRGNLSVETHHWFNSTLVCDLIVHCPPHPPHRIASMLAVGVLLSPISLDTSEHRRSLIFALLPHLHVRQCHDSPSLLYSSPTSRSMISIRMSKECIGSLFTAQSELAQLFPASSQACVPYPQVVWHLPVHGTQCPKWDILFFRPTRQMSHWEAHKILDFQGPVCQSRSHVH